MTAGDVAEAIEGFAPLALQAGYDNAGLQVGDPSAPVGAVLLCLDVTEEVLDEAVRRQCDMVVSHHPLIFRGLKSLTGADRTQRLVMRALAAGLAVYSAHTNLDSAWNGVSHEMAHMLGVTELEVLEPAEGRTDAGLGVVGNIDPTPKFELLRRIKDCFGVKALRYSAVWPGVVVKRVALCGGSGASLAAGACRKGADIFVTGDIKYHDFTEWGHRMLLADIGHYEGELCSMRIFSRILRSRWPGLVVCFSDDQANPVAVI